MQVVELVWLVPLMPLLGFTFLLFFGRRLGEPLAGWVATAAMGASFAAAVAVFFGMVGLQGGDRIVEVELFEWIAAGDFSVNIGLVHHRRRHADPSVFDRLHAR